MLTTRTGNFPIGFRRGWSEWQRDLPALTQWARSYGFGLIDLGTSTADMAQVLEAGLGIGSMDLLDWSSLFSADSGKRASAIERNTAYIQECGAAGIKNFFLVVLPEDPALPRVQNFGYAVESLNALAPSLEKVGARAVIEGYPGAGALCCTPETCRATFRECASPSIGINYDPSHLLRMGIDPIRFLKEFAPRVGHVHGKDTEIVSDDLYEYGWEQPATFKENPAFGGAVWRYTIPGQGSTNWAEVLRILAAHNYGGSICIELEDKHYNGSQEGEQRGLIAGAQFLSAC